MTSMPATHFGLRDRGQLVRGYLADVVVLDLGALAAQRRWSGPRSTPRASATSS